MRFALTLLFIFLFGCATIRDKDLKAKLSPPVTVEEAVADTYFTEGEWPSEDWWMVFDDPYLTWVVKGVLDANPTLHAAEMRAKAALNEAFQVRSSLFPQVNADAGFNWQHLSKDNLYRIPPSFLPAVIYQLTLAVDLTYEFDLWGKNRKRYAAALGQVRTDIAETAMVKLHLSVTTAQTYFRLQTGLEKRAVLCELKCAHKKLYDLEQARFDSGLDDLRRSKQRAAQIKRVDEEIASNEEQIALAKHYLGTLMGTGPTEELNELRPKSSYDDRFPLPEHLSMDLLARRPDIVARVWQVEKMAYMIGVAKTLFYPDLNLRLMGGLESLSWRKFFDHESLAGSFNPAIHLPIFVGGRLRANLDARVADFEQAVYEYNHTLLHAAQDVSDRITELTASAKRLEDQLSIEDDLEMVYDLDYIRYRSGLDNRLSLLDSEVELLQARLKKVDYSGDRLKSVANLIKSLGGGYEDCSNKQEEWAKDARDADRKRRRKRKA